MNRTPLAAVLIGGILLLIFNSAYLVAKAMASTLRNSTIACVNSRFRNSTRPI